MKLTISKDTFAEVVPDGIKIKEIVASKAKCLEQQGEDDSFFLCDIGDVFEKFKKFKHYLPNVEPFYAVKCNDSPAMLNVLHKLGLGFDCASKAEIKTMLDIGVHSDRIIFAHPCKQVSHLRFAATNNVSLMTFDNADELYKIKKAFPAAHLVIRLKVDDSHSLWKFSAKFGTAEADVKPLLKLAKSLGLTVVGVSFHVGSLCYNPTAFYDAVKSGFNAFQVAKIIGYEFNFLDIGGGFPGDKHTKIPFEDCAFELNRAFVDYFPASSGVRIIAEPGAFFASSAFTLACNIIGKASANKMNEEKNGTTEELMYHVNEGIYNSCNFVINDPSSEHLLLKPVKTEKNEELVPSVIWGQSCDGNDCIAKHMMLPKMEIGDWLYMKNMGAYRATVASSFNGFPKACSYYYIRDSAFKELNHILN